MSRLHLRFLPADEMHGELVATISAQGFQAKGSAWFNHEDLRNFSRAMQVYPLSAASPPSIFGGIWDEGGPALKQVCLGIEVTPHDVRGRLRVAVQVASEGWCFENNGLSCEATVRFLATYADISRFATAVLSLADGRCDDATLLANETDL